MMTMMTHEKRLNTFCVDKKYDVKNDHNLDFLISTAVNCLL